MRRYGSEAGRTGDSSALACSPNRAEDAAEAAPVVLLLELRSVQRRLAAWVVHRHERAAAPRRPTASATKITFASSVPFAGPSTWLCVMRSHLLQAATSLTSRVNARRLRGVNVSAGGRTSDMQNNSTRSVSRDL